MARQTKTLKKFAEELGKVVAKDFYEMFSDSINCGPNFTWDRFPDLVVRFAQKQLFIQTTDIEYKRCGEELEKIINKVAFDEAKKLSEGKENE